MGSELIHCSNETRSSMQTQQYAFHLRRRTGYFKRVFYTAEMTLGFSPGSWCHVSNKATGG